MSGGPGVPDAPDVPGDRVPADRAATIALALASATRRLRARERFGTVPSEAPFDARVLLAHILERNSAWLLAHDDAPLAAADRARFEAALDRRLGGEPVAYIVGSAGFFGRTFAVDSNVLVPRPETEGAVEVVLAHVRAHARARRASATDLHHRAPGLRARAPVLRICDVGTGSGCIAITLACELPEAHLTAIDISPRALTVARANARSLGVDDRIDVVAGDGLVAADPGMRFDCIVANLPYVKSGDLAPAPDPTSFEPQLALDGGADGLDAYRALLADAPARLEPGGLLVMEAGHDTVPALADLAARAFPRARVTTVRDGAGLDRFAVVTAES